MPNNCCVKLHRHCERSEAIQGPQHARRQQPRRSYRGPWIRFANKKQTVTALILLEKLCTEKERRRCRFLAKNEVGTCGISERRSSKGTGRSRYELAMTDRELAHLFLRVAQARSSQILMGTAVARLGAFYRAVRVNSVLKVVSP